MADSLHAFFIPDGCTLTAHILAVPGVHPALSFTYRPGVIADRNQYRAPGATPDEINKRMATLLRAKVVSIEGLSNPFENRDPLRIWPTLLEKMIDIVLNYSSSDEAVADAGN